MNDKDTFLPVVEAYDRWASFYDSYDNPMTFAASQALEGLAGAADGKVIVEFGCGTGRNLARLKQGGAEKLIGCDVSAGMLEKARALDPAFILVQQDMTQPLPLADGIADLVLFSLALEHVSDLIPPLREARRLLRTNGTIKVIEIHPFLSLGQVSAHFRDGADIVRMPTFPHRFSDYINAAADVGLAINDCREWRPRDFHGTPPQKIFKRGPDVPMLVDLTLTKAGRVRS
ncbi:Class I SAM-dependent methyltransferase [Rhodovastum atsumiense]|uniref:Class I SAM-dependent methyltransferase n=1 Tax=Rhodovastum atsumiense TaxID=504468 RepID=A0A5M6IPV4_9PROT|nr:class I SAM-dependent methyltransferase [Rhodovastum atsumiense]KAA5610310.1 class I SAM-dependent methyltransferase [Rhodovastum atsumiense]CAH2602200.1 Class I SAM-dependent methyltransferase [Rhodovastum atsumiense]